MEVDERTSGRPHPADRQTAGGLRDDCNDDVFAAIKALNAADALYDSDAITAHRCAEFLDAWVGDMAAWNTAYARTGSLGKLSDAMTSLQITTWEQVW